MAMTLFKFVTFVITGKYVVFRLFVALLTTYKCTSLSPVNPKSRVALVANRAVKRKGLSGLRQVLARLS